MHASDKNFMPNKFVYEPPVDKPTNERTNPGHNIANPTHGMT